MNAADFLPQQFRIAIEGDGQGPGRAKGEEIHGHGALAQCPQQQLDPQLLESRQVQHAILRRAHGLKGPDGTGNVAVEEIIQLQNGNETGIARSVGVAVGGVRMMGLRLPVAVRGIQDHGPQIDLGQTISGDQVEVVAHVLMRMIQVGAVDDRDTVRDGFGCLAAEAWEEESSSGECRQERPAGEELPARGWITEHEYILPGFTTETTAESLCHCPAFYGLGAPFASFCGFYAVLGADSGRTVEWPSGKEFNLLATLIMRMVNDLQSSSRKL